MLNIYFGDMENSIYDPESYFKFNWEEDWILDPLSKKMIEDIDKSIVLGNSVIKSPVFGLIPPERLSGGVKTLILINNETNKIFNASACGDNCSKWIVEIAKNKDITINLRHIMDFGDLEFEANILNTNQKVNGMEELFFVACDYV